MTPTVATPDLPAVPAGVPLPVKSPYDEPPLYGVPPEAIPDLTNIETEDGAPVDNIFVEKQNRLLTEPLYSSWAGPGDERPFLALANVGLFHTYRQPPLVPDVLLGIDVELGQDLRLKENRSYFIWILGKPPDVAVEIVSDRHGDEEYYKMRMYARVGVLFYVIFDPENRLEHGVLRAFVLQRNRYEPVEPDWLPEVGLGLKLWEGKYEGQHQTWLRWCDRDGMPVATGAEKAAEEYRRAEDAQRRADDERRRADDAQRRADDERRRADDAEEKMKRLAAQLRALGADPDA